MTEWNDKKSIGVSFRVEMKEELLAFVRRMEEEQAEIEEVFKQRIKQLFEEQVSCEVGLPDEFYNKILQVFTIGYQCGWNDRRSITQ